MRKTTRVIWASAACIALAASALASDHKNSTKAPSANAKRPKVTLTTNTQVGISPTKITLTAQLWGESNDEIVADCPTLVWDWGDGTRSESSVDCKPNQSRASEITRITTEHVFEDGSYDVELRLVSRGKPLASARTSITVVGALYGDQHAAPEEADGMGGPGEMSGVPPKR